VCSRAPKLPRTGSDDGQLWNARDARSRRPHLHDRAADRAQGPRLGRLPSPVHAPHPAREPAAQRRRRGGRRERHRGRCDLGPRREAVARDPVHARSRADAGLHRRARRRRSGGDARRDVRDGGRSLRDQPAAAGRARDRPLGAGRHVRHGAVAGDEQRDRVRAQQGALRVLALGPDRVRELQGRAAEHGHRAPGQPRAPGARRDGRRAGR